MNSLGTLLRLFLCPLPAFDRGGKDKLCAKDMSVTYVSIHEFWILKRITNFQNSGGKDYGIQPFYRREAF